MKRLDYTQLRCFKAVANYADVAVAAQALKMPAGVVGTHLRAFERELGHALFQQDPQGLVVTGFGRSILTYAEEIFGAEERLLGYAAGDADAEHEQFIVGLPDVIPKLVAHELLRPALERATEFQLVCREGKLDGLLAEMALHKVDLILSDCPASPSREAPVHSQWLGQCGVEIFGNAEIVKPLRDGFPGSLNGAPMLLPARRTAAREKFDLWCANRSCKPRVVAEFDDTALLKVAGRGGYGLFPAPSAVADQICQQYQVEPLGRLDGVKEEYFAISLERRLKHPLVEGIVRSAKSGIFGQSGKLDEAGPVG